MKNLTWNEIHGITGGECYHAEMDIFGLKIGIHIGDCPMG